MRLNYKPFSSDLALYKLITLLYQEAKITKIKIKMLSETKQ